MNAGVLARTKSRWVGAANVGVRGNAAGTKQRQQQWRSTGLGQARREWHGERAWWWCLLLVDAGDADVVEDEVRDARDWALRESRSGGGSKLLGASLGYDTQPGNGTWARQYNPHVSNVARPLRTCTCTDTDTGIYAQEGEHAFLRVLEPSWVACSRRRRVPW